MAFELDSRIAGSTHLIKSVDGIQVRLVDDARDRGLLLVPEVAGASELHDLGTADQQRLITLATRLGEWLTRTTAAEKINTAIIGNVVAQLHLHVVARHAGDAVWPAPIWGLGEPQPRTSQSRATTIVDITKFLETRSV